MAKRNDFMQNGISTLNAKPLAFNVKADWLLEIRDRAVDELSLIFLRVSNFSFH